MSGERQFPPMAVEIPYLTTEQMVAVDRALIEEYDIRLEQVMENAGRALAHLARSRFLEGNPRGKRIAVLAGTGGNGGGALVAARRLANYGADVQVAITLADDAFKPVPAHQLQIVRHMDLPVRQGAVESADGKLDLILDGLIGYSLQGAPRGGAADLIRWANGYPAPVLALDVPSGVDTTTGAVYEPAIQAAVTLTLALPKEGLRAEGLSNQVGELYLADISVPPALYASLGLRVGPIFAESDIVRLL